MSLENEVPSLELCKRWKEIGGRQDTCFSWEFFDKEKFSCLNDVWVLQSTASILQEDECRVAAPLASELMEWMKAILDISSTVEEWEIVMFQTCHLERSKSLPNALMQMAIWEKEAPCKNK